MKKIILISGEAQHGKDSTALILKEKLNGKVLILHYADYLKYMCKQYLGWNGNKDDNGRSLLQYVGTDLIRDKLNMQNFHVDKICEAIKIFEQEFDYFIVPDLRRKNEIFITKGNFPDNVITTRVYRLKEGLPYNNGLTEEQKNHISERDLRYFPHDYYIESEDGLDNLAIEVDKFIEESGLC